SLHGALPISMMQSSTHLQEVWITFHIPLWETFTVEEQLNLVKKITSEQNLTIVWTFRYSSLKRKNGSSEPGIFRSIMSIIDVIPFSIISIRCSKKDPQPERMY